MGKYRIVLLLFVLLLAQGTLAAGEGKIIFATAPTQSAEVTRELYTPLLTHLSRETGREFVLETASNFVEYTNKMRSGHYDMLFDGPHFVGWRMDRLGHQPLARFPGQIRIVVVTGEDAPYSRLQELAARKVCTFASPNMLTMAFLQYIPNHARQPTLVRAQGFPGLVECLRSGKGEAAVLRDKFWNKKMDQSGLRLLAAPAEGYPERTFSISGALDEELRQQVAEALLSEAGREAAAPLLKRFKRDRLVAAKRAEYKGVGRLLNPVWGFAY